MSQDLPFRISSNVRILVLILLDLLLAVLSLMTAMLLRFDGYAAIPGEQTRVLPVAVGLLLLVRFVSNFGFRLHRWSFRYSGLMDGVRVAIAVLCGSAFFTLGLYLLGINQTPRSVIVLEWLLTTLLMSALRFAPRWLLTVRGDLLRSRRSNVVRTLIVGAGSAGEMLLRDLRRSDEHDYHVVGFVDDDKRRRGDIVSGRSVLGTTDELPKIATRYAVEQVLIAIPRLPPARVREILQHCSNLKLQFKILPVSYVYLEEQGRAPLLEDLQPEDLLSRAEVNFSDTVVRAMPTERVLMVVGAAGSIGSEVCVQLLDGGCRSLLMLDNNENGLYILRRRFEKQYPDRTIFTEVANIRDIPRMANIFARYGPQDIFHAAARKHVPLMESAVCEAVKTNVIGTRNLALLADRHGVQRFVYMSTDKAVRPTSVMGASKRLGEMLILHMDAISKTRFSVVRFGNVLDSAGSVVPLFREQIADGGPVTVTHPEMRRFFMTISEAVGLVLRAAYGDYGHLCVLEMGEPIRILDLARLMITMSGKVPDVDIPIRITSLRPGEKLYEELLGDGEEVLEVIDKKIRVVRCLPPPEGLMEKIDHLEQVAATDDDKEARAILHDLLIDYRHPMPESSTKIPRPSLPIR